MGKTSDESARRRAEELWDKGKRRGAAAPSDREIALRAEAAKTARLRELRLAKEAAERDTAMERRRGRRRRSAEAPAEDAEKTDDLSGKVETAER